MAKYNGGQESKSENPKAIPPIEGLIDVIVPSNCTRYLNFFNVARVDLQKLADDKKLTRYHQGDVDDNLRGMTNHWEKLSSKNEGGHWASSLKWNQNADAKKGDTAHRIGNVPFLDGNRRYIVTDWGFYMYDLLGYAKMYGVSLFEEPVVQPIKPDNPEADKPAPGEEELVFVPPSPEWKIDHHDTSCHQVDFVAQANMTQVSFKGPGGLADAKGGSDEGTLTWTEIVDLVGVDMSILGPDGLYGRFYGKVVDIDAPVGLYGYHFLQERFLSRVGITAPFQKWPSLGIPPLWIPANQNKETTGSPMEFMPSLNGHEITDLENAMNHSHTVYMDRGMNGFTVDTIQHEDSKWNAIADHVHPVINGKIMPIALHIYSPWAEAAPDYSSGPHWPLLFPPDVKWIHDHTAMVEEKELVYTGIPGIGMAGATYEVVTTTVPKYFAEDPFSITELAEPDKFMEMIELRHSIGAFENIFHYNGLEKHPWWYGYEFNESGHWGPNMIPLDNDLIYDATVPASSIRAYLQADVGSFGQFLVAIGATLYKGKLIGEPLFEDEGTWAPGASSYYTNKVYSTHLNLAGLKPKSHCVAGDPYMYSLKQEEKPDSYFWPTKENDALKRLIAGIYLDFRTPVESQSPVVFEDHVHQVCTADPLTKEIKSEYNYHNVDFEDVTTSKYVPLPYFPNFYLFALYQDSPFHFKFLPTINGLNIYTDLFSLGNNIEVGKQGSNMFYQGGLDTYYKEWSLVIGKVSAFFQGMSIIDFENFELSDTFFFDYDDFKLLRNYEYTKILFPMYFEMFWNVPKSSETSIIDIFAKNPSLCEHLVSCVRPATDEVVSDAEHADTIKFLMDNQESGLKNEFNFEAMEHIQENRTWDVTKLIYKYAYEGDANIPNFDGVHMNSEPPMGAANDEFKVIEAYNDLTATIREKFRCMQEVFDGELAYNEVVFFELLKYDPKDESKIQRYYFANPYGLDPKTSTRSDLIKFIDTQIVYEKDYSYAIFQYSMIVGNKYHYVDHMGFMGTPTYGRVITPGLGNPSSAGHIIVPWSKKLDVTSHFKIINEPQILLKKTEYASLGTINVSDEPPVPPDSVIYPYKDVKDKILIWFRTNMGEFDAIPITILPGDDLLFETIAASQGIDSINQPIHFKTDDPIKQYQIFRLDEKPTKWKDFAGGETFLLEEGVVSHLDKIEPNKKYYYTFRAIDFHDKISNPSSIFEVELVHNSGATYPLINVAQFEIKPTKTKHKNMRKYIHIIPTLEQSMLTGHNPADPDVTSALGLTPMFGTVFGGIQLGSRKFKIRITSKSSGRKFDLNLNFAHDHKDEVKK